MKTYSTLAQTRISPTLELGTALYSGDEINSLSGSKGYFLQFKSEESRGHFRPSVGIQFDYSKGDAYLASNILSYTMYGGSFQPGCSLYIFDSGHFQPFISGQGALGWNFFSVPPSSNINSHSQSFSYGYEVSAGVDIRFQRNRGDALRLRGGLWTLHSQIASINTYKITGLRFSTGMVFE